jgi:hypothetical protein
MAARRARPVRLPEPGGNERQLTLACFRRFRWLRNFLLDSAPRER